VRRAVLATALTAVSPAAAGAQVPDSTMPPPGGAQLATPLASLFLPGIGQVRRNATTAAAAFSGAAVAGYALYATAGSSGRNGAELPREASGQQALLGLLLYQGSGEVSAYDAFHSALPALHHEGKYRFTTSHASTLSLLTAPFDPTFLARWTTWVDLAFTGAVAALVLRDRKPDQRYDPYIFRDAVFGTGVSLSAGIGEEAVFRGWLLPLLHQNTGERFWLANGIQAAAFGGLHVGAAGDYAVLIGAFALYQGWLTRRNGWSVRESVFQHFWYDAIVIAAELLTDPRPRTMVIRLPTIRF
jgi:membrane protease YdiL (CAAX protease family)